jgi:hypothetical protein
LIVDFAVVWIGAGVQVLLAAEFEQLDAVVGADLVSEVVEEFEHREEPVQIIAAWLCSPYWKWIGGAVTPPCYLLGKRRYRDHLAMPAVTAQPTEKAALEKPRVEPIGLRPCIAFIEEFVRSAYLPRNSKR